MNAKDERILAGMLEFANRISNRTLITIAL